MKTDCGCVTRNYVIFNVLCASSGDGFTSDTSEALPTNLKLSIISNISAVDRGNAPYCSDRRTALIIAAKKKKTGASAATIFTDTNRELRECQN